MKITLPFHLRLHDHSDPLDGSPIAIAGMAWARAHDHSLAADGSPIAVAGVPNLDVAKITSGRFPMARMPAGTLGDVLTAQGAGVSPAYAPAPTGLLVAASGNQASNAAASNLSTIALTGLLITDSLLVVWRFNSAVGNSCSYELYSVTDAVTLATLLTADGAGAGNAFTIHVYLGQAPDSALTVATAGFRQRAGIAQVQINVQAAVATAWTGAWTLALRSGPGTAGGTDYWAWAVYKLR